MADDFRITLKAARVNANLTLEQAAELIGVSVPSVSKWERGASVPSSLHLQKACDVYDVPVGLIILPNG